jgi:hypothetical protein
MSNDFDLQSHSDMWNGFIKMATIFSAVVAVTLLLMAYFLL